jgi:hypothetical protein
MVFGEYKTEEVLKYMDTYPVVSSMLQCKTNVTARGLSVHLQ